MKQMAQFSIRIPSEDYRKLKFIAADQDKAINKLVTEILQEHLATARISVPTELLEPQEPH